MFGFSGGEILFIALIALVLFGNEKLPENLKKFMHGLKKVRKVSYDAQKSWQDIKYDVENSIDLTPKVAPALHKTPQKEIEPVQHETSRTQKNEIL